MNHPSKKNRASRLKIFVVYTKKDGSAQPFMRHRVKFFPKFYKWLDANYPQWRYGNVWYGGKMTKSGWRGGVQVGNFTNKVRPVKPYTL